MSVPPTGSIEEQVLAWIEQVVVGLHLCPFAARIDRRRQLRISVSSALTPAALLADLEHEIEFLGARPAEELETTILVAPQVLGEFAAFNDFLDPVDALIDHRGWIGKFQVASFHPDYRFAGTEADAIENFTNRSPFPLLHILREASIEQVLASWPDAGTEVPAANLRTLDRLSAARRAALWPHVWG